MTDLLSTARLQLHRGFDLDAAAGVVPYYAALGISHLYLSPIATATAGSMHGYDVVDPTTVSAELGGEDALRRLAGRLRRRGMGMIVDIVPNHMAASVENPWWRDVLANGEESGYAHYFDIDWQSSLAPGKVWLPVLDDDLAEAVAKGLIRIDAGPSSGDPFLSFAGSALPLSARGMETLLGVAGMAASRPRDRNGLLREWRRAVVDPQLRGRIVASLAAINDEPARLEAFIDIQHYRPASWRSADNAINYRRFFDISSLVALSVEHDDVFDAVHALPLRLIGEGVVDGLRIDHVDGLSAPRRYLTKLRGRLDDAQSLRPRNVPARVALHVEKILARDEALRVDWPVDGTTGYEFMDRVSAVFHHPAGHLPLRQAWSQASGRSGDFAKEQRQARVEILAKSLRPELETAVRAWQNLMTGAGDAKRATSQGLAAALACLLEHMPVYRTYLEHGRSTGTDRRILEEILADAWRWPERGIPEHLRTWLLDPPAHSDPDALRLARRRLEQASAPLNAKAVEDTAFYRHGVLVSRNDVGSNPDDFSCTREDFHAFMLRRAASWPRSLSATATHDHKRGEDTRSRMAVIAQLPELFTDLACGLLTRHAGCRESPMVDAGDLWILLQQVLGAWPLGLRTEDSAGMGDFFERMAQWQVKALREAKLRSSWATPNKEYEHACTALLRTWLMGEPYAPLRDRLQSAAHALDVPGAAIAMATTVLRLTAPGVPDLYQGTEYWDQSLVDPDNRRAVDYRKRRLTLTEPFAPAEFLRDFGDGRIKQRIVQLLLHLRRERPQLFTEGAYRPLTVTGEFADRTIAFARRWNSERCVVLVPRLCSDWLATEREPAIPPQYWNDTTLHLEADDAACTFRNVFKGDTKLAGAAVPVRQLLGGWPVSVLVT